ncbi:MAG TPA: ABC transporter ATP-binding protein [Rhodopila sp.]|nr:ABC transporter ATP-binding protein [Rhodopila sp.]
MAHEPILTMAGVHARYDVTPVLRGIDLTVAAGEIVAVIGRNGVGKTTLMRCTIGLLPAASGAITYAGRNITSFSADRRARLGIGYIPQGRDVFPRMTVEENLQVGELIGQSRKPPATDLVFDYFPILKERRKQLAGTMSGGQQQQLAIGRALIGSPKLLLLDEPSEGIQPSIVQMICRALRSIRDKFGTTIVFVEQNLDTILALAERCVVMEKGQIIAEIPAGQVTQDSVRQHLLI